MKVDLGNRLKFPEHITETTLRPDIVLWSNKTKQVLMYELTCPWEENIEVAHERKRSKYQELVETCIIKGWWMRCHPIEIGAKGFAGRSLTQTLNQLGISGRKKRNAVNALLDTASKSSRWHWLVRANAN